MNNRVLVVFKAGEETYAVDVGHTRGVQAAEDIRPLLAPQPGVVGLLRPTEDALPVVRVFPGELDIAEHEHVIEVAAGGQRFGLLVERVTGVVRVAGEEVGPAPAGQADPIVAGIVRAATTHSLLLDPAVLARRLFREARS